MGEDKLIVRREHLTDVVPQAFLLRLLVRDGGFEPSISAVQVRRFDQTKPIPVI